MTLNKTAIIEKIYSELDIQQKEAVEIVESLIEILKATLESGDDILISGFGKFCLKEKAQRKGRNPATGETATLPPRRVVTFKWSQKLREKLNREHVAET
jgi:integration host factor subunit alpha